MSIRKPKKIEELVQILRIASENPSLMKALAPTIFEEIGEKAPYDAEISFVSFKAGQKREGIIDEKLERQVAEICQKIRLEVLEQVRSDISRLIVATKKETSIEEMTHAINESIKKLSQIRDVKKIYIFPEPETLQLVIIHDADDMIALLKKVVEVENLLDAKFEGIYFEFKILHSSEIDENLISEGLLIFERI